MRILFLTQIIPYPPDAGPRVKTWHVLQYLIGAGHEVILASFVRPDEEPYVAMLQKVCTAVYTVPMKRSRLADVGYMLRSSITGRPFLIERDDLPAMRELVQRLLATEAIDIIHADQLTMTQFALDVQPCTIFDAHNATWTITQRMFTDTPWFLRLLLRLETERTKRYEGMLVRAFDHTLVVIRQDRQALLQGVPEAERTAVGQRIRVVPIAVDTYKLQPVVRQPDSTNIMTLGSLHYPPNADGIRWFVREVFPLIQQQAPEATLTIIGKNPPADFLQLAAQQPHVVKVTGYVPDLTPYMAAAALLVVPVRAGSGMRVRLLEAFARGMPAVTTTIGLEGIEATHGREVLVADEPIDFAQTTLALLRDPEQQQFLAENGRQLAETKYDWHIALKKMDAVYTMDDGQTATL